MLRKEFTENIIKLLNEKRYSINLVGNKGTGKTRVLEDIYNSLEDVKCVILNMEYYKLSYSEFIKNISLQLQSKKL